MHIAFVYFNDYDQHLSPRENLEHWFSITDWSKALAARGLQISVFFRHGRNEIFSIDGADYYAFSDHLPPSITNRHLPIVYLWKIKKILKRRPPDIIHAHNLNAVTHNLLLNIMVSIPMVIQDHASLPNHKYAFFYRLLFKRMEAVLFSAPGQEVEWIRRRYIPEAEKVMFIMESSSTFEYEERSKARAQTNIKGEPVFLWVGNLTENKDPITILKAFKAVFWDFSDPILLMVYREKPLEREVREFINKHPSLSTRVQLLGAVPRSSMEAIYNSADYFLLGSHKEGSGYALMEAMACGVIPIVTKIPSFERLLGNGTIGGLWNPGRIPELKQSIRDISRRPVEVESFRVRNYFNQHFSFEALAERAVEIYKEVIRKE